MCGAEKHAATLSLETNLVEIVDVDAVVLTPDDPIARDCTIEQMWSTELTDRDAFRQRHHSWTVATKKP